MLFSRYRTFLPSLRQNNDPGADVRGLEFGVLLFGISPGYLISVSTPLKTSP
jgi:hypothetical protein